MPKHPTTLTPKPPEPKHFGARVIANFDDPGLEQTWIADGSGAWWNARSIGYSHGSASWAELTVIRIEDTGGDVLTRTATMGRCTYDGTHCPGAGCGADLMRVGLTHLAYVFETCNCDGPVGADLEPYAHLAEQLWHRECLAAKAATGA